MEDGGVIIMNIGFTVKMKEVWRMETEQDSWMDEVCRKLAEAEASVQDGRVEDAFASLKELWSRYASIVSADSSNIHIIQNFFPLFQHDIAEVCDEHPNIHGVFWDPIGEERTNSEVSSRCESWVGSDTMFPYLIYAGELPVGYVLITEETRTEEYDWLIDGIFIVRPMRGKGIASAALRQLLLRFPGRFKLQTAAHPRNAAA